MKQVDEPGTVEIQDAEEARNKDSSIRKDTNTENENIQKNELILWIKLSQTQRTLYKAFLESEEVKSIFNSSRSPLAALTVLKKVCDHPRLLTEEMKMCKALMLEKYRLSSVLEV